MLDPKQSTRTRSFCWRLHGHVRECYNSPCPLTPSRRLVSQMKRCYSHAATRLFFLSGLSRLARFVPVGTFALWADARRDGGIVWLPFVIASLASVLDDFLCSGCHSFEYIPEKNIPSRKNLLDSDIYLRVIYSPWEGVTAMENLREQKGLEIAAKSKLERSGDRWFVPSQTRNSGPNFYTVKPDTWNPHCTCPDHETRQVKCKHIFAVEFTIRREYTDDGEKQTVTETVTVRKTYKQEWPAYNAAQTNEKDQFQTLLHQLCKGVGEPSQKMGRPRLPFEDMIFSTCFKVYSTVSWPQVHKRSTRCTEKGIDFESSTL